MKKLSYKELKKKLRESDSKDFYKLLFVIALIFVTFASFETYFQVFELYIVNKHPLINKKSELTLRM